MRFFSLIAILAAAVLAVLVDDAADLNPRQVEASSHQNNGRWAGCSCLGWPFSNWVFKPQAAGHRNGWCWVDSKMIVRDENLVRLAVLNNRHTAAVNGIEANIWCRAQGIRMQTVACVNRVIREFTATQGPGLISLCTYPSPGTFIPTSCDCPYNCVSGRVRCGKWCVARGTQCNGGVPVERLCEPGWVLCRGVCVRAGTCAQVLPVPGLPGEPRVLGELDAELEERDADAELEERG